MAEQARTGCGGHNAAAIPLEKALELVLAAVRPVQETQQLALMAALGRTLAESVRSRIDVPGHTNSAMDGYALRHADLPASGQVSLRVAGESFAGRPYGRTLNPGECVRIMTGAVVPDGADTVVMQEEVAHADGVVEVNAGLRCGEHVRAAGEDIRAGMQVLAAGRRLRPADLGLLASVGVGEVAVTRRVRVAYLSTGDELRPVGTTLETGQIYDSNRYTLHGMLAEAGVEALDLGVIPDEPDALRQALGKAAGMADVVLTSGGVSVGEADYVTDVLEELGEIGFWQIAMKPGRPLAFGRLGSALFFGLPGNPVSVMATFLQVVRPALAVISGGAYEPPVRFSVRALGRLNKKPGRMEFQRGVLTQDPEGQPGVRSTGHQGSGILRSMSEANCFIVLERERGPVASGEWVVVEPFPGC